LLLIKKKRTEDSKIFFCTRVTTFSKFHVFWNFPKLLHVTFTSYIIFFCTLLSNVQTIKLANIAKLCKYGNVNTISGKTELRDNNNCGIFLLVESIVFRFIVDDYSNEERYTRASRFSVTRRCWDKPWFIVTRTHASVFIAVIVLAGTCLRYLPCMSLPTIRTIFSRQYIELHSTICTVKTNFQLSIVQGLT